MNPNDELVRDNALEQSTTTVDYHIACDLEYKEKLLERLVRETETFRDVRSPEKLADILQVIHTIMTDYGWTREDIEVLRQERQDHQGGFEKHIVLEK